MDSAAAATGDLGGWTVTTPLTLPTWAFAAAASPSYVYVSGGETNASGPIVELTGTARAAINPGGSLAPWEAQTFLGAARIDHGMVYTETSNGNRCLYVVGGYATQSTRVTNTVEFATVGPEGTLSAWTQTTPMNASRAHFGLAAYNGGVYALGGLFNNSGAPTSTVEFASINGDCSLGEWQTTTPMTATHSSNRAFAANGFIYSTGDLSDSLGAGVQYAPINSDGTLGVWAVTSSMNQKRGDHAVIADSRSGYAYALGGLRTSPFTRTATVERASLSPDGTLGEWNLVTSLPAPSEDMAFAQSNGRIYMLGGYSSGITTSVYFSEVEGSGSPDLSTSSKQVSSSIASPGQALTYTITVNNTGRASATARLTDTLPASVTYASGSASNGAAYDAASRSIRWSGVATVGTPVSITYRAVVTSPLDNGSLITNSATINDGNGSVFDTAPVTTTISSAADLSSSAKTVKKAIASPGGTVSYSVVVSNTGTMNTAAWVTDTLPLSLTYVVNTVRSTMGTSVYDSGSGSILWTGPALVSVPVTITYQAKTPESAASGTLITSTATIKGTGSAARETAPVAVTVASNPARIGWQNLGLYGVRDEHIVIDANSGTMYLASGGTTGVYRSVDGGNTWLPSASVSGCLRVLLDQNSGAVYASCSPGANEGGLWKSSDHGLTWVPVLTRTLVPTKLDGPVTAVAISGSTLYAADGNSPEMPAAGIWASTDAGATWTRKSTGQSNGINAVALDATNPAVVYAATSANVYRSDNGGVNWADMTPTGGSNFQVLAASPLTTGMVFVASGYDGALKAYKSSNSGLNWSTVHAPTDPRETPIAAITFHPTDPNRMYSEIGESIDGGDTWHFAQGGPGGRGGAIHPFNPNIVFAAFNPGVRRSSDGGATWTPVNAGLEEVAIWGIAENPRDPNNYLIASGMGFGSTLDNGANWNWPLDMSGMPQPDMFGDAVAIDPSAAYLSGGDSIFGRSTDSGRTWSTGNLQQVVTNDLTLSYRPGVSELRLVPGEAGHLLASVREQSAGGHVPRGGVYESTDGGLTWSSTGLTGVPVNSLDLGQSDGRTIIYAGAGDSWGNYSNIGGVYTTTVGNTSVWSQTSVSTTAPLIMRVRLDPTNPLVVYAGGGFNQSRRSALFKTTDGGGTWHDVLSESQASDQSMVRAIAVDPAFTNSVFYASGNRVYQSVDRGGTWTLFSEANLGFGRINALIVPLSSPSPVLTFTATLSGSQTSLNWTEPSESNLAGVVVKYSTQGFPMLSTEGITLTTKQAGDPGVYAHTNTISGTTYYYSAFTYNQAGRYSLPYQVAANPGAAALSTSASELSLRSTLSLPRRPAAEATNSRSLYAAAGGGLFAKSLDRTSVYLPALTRSFSAGW